MGMEIKLSDNVDEKHGEIRVENKTKVQSDTNVTENVSEKESSNSESVGNSLNNETQPLLDSKDTDDIPNNTNMTPRHGHVSNTHEIGQQCNDIVDEKEQYSVIDDEDTKGDIDTNKVGESPEIPVCKSELNIGFDEKQNNASCDKEVQNIENCDVEDENKPMHSENSVSDTSVSIEGKKSETVSTDIEHLEHFKTTMHSLKRRTTTPNLFENRVHSTKVLQKRNTVPSNLSNTLLMVGRMHDVEDRTLENIKRLSLDVEESTTNGENQIDRDSMQSKSDVVDSDIPKAQCSVPAEEIGDTLLNAHNTKEAKTDNIEEKTVQIKVIPVQPQPETHETTKHAFVNTEQCNQNDELATNELDTVNHRLRSSSRVSIQVNDTPVNDDMASTSNCVPPQPQLSIESDVTTEELSERLFQPCLINISSCSSATMEGELSSENNVDQNLLFVNDSDNTSLNHYKTVKRNRVAPSKPR